MGKHSRKKKKSVVSATPKKVPAPPPRLRIRPPEMTLFRGHCSDLLSMVLVRWRYSQLLHFSRLVLAVLMYTGELHQFAEEQSGAATVELEQNEHSSVTLVRFYSDVLKYAETTGASENEASDYYRALLRGCFLVALVCDIRVRRFCFAQHTVFERRALHCTVVPQWKREGFMAEARALVCELLEKRLSLRLLSDYGVQCWREDYLLRETEAYHELAIDEEGTCEDVQVAFLGGGGIDGDEEVVYGAT